MTNKFPTGWVKTTLGEINMPSRARVLPSEAPELPYVGMEHVEAQTMRLLGQGTASGLKSSFLRFNKGDVLYGKMRGSLSSTSLPKPDVLAAEIIEYLEECLAEFREVEAELRRL